MEKLVTVVIPAYNASRYIEETIASVLNQSYRSFEVIVVDDGSTDETLEIARKFSADPRVQVISQLNSGVSAARNSGLQKARGEYIAFLDADDVWLPENLLLKVNALDADPLSGLVHAGVAIIDENSDLTGQEMHGQEGEILEALLEWKGCQVPGPSSILARTDLVRMIGGFDTRLSTAADQDIFIRIAARSRIARVHKVLAHYRVHGSNMHRNIAAMEKDEFLVYAKAKESGLFRSARFMRKCFSNMYLVLAGSWWVNGNNKARAIQLMAKAVIAYPPNITKLLAKISS